MADNTIAITAVKNFVNDCLNQGVKINSAWLFGSYAKGNYNEDSDIDIAVVFKDYSNLIDMQLELMRLRRKIDSRIEPHPFRENEFELSNPIVSEILKYGQEIDIKVV